MVAGDKSEPFAIGDDLYASLRTDALAYFCHNRSGIEIDADLVGEEYARPAGHVNVSPNQGDNDVPCRPGVCDYRLDAAGGWYDAGDHGKYVVNGGISVAQLMSAFERTLTEESADAAPLGDGELPLPEHGNATPDILDEARWEMDFRGPNDAVRDPLAQSKLKGCAPAMCYIDHIESWATNEVTINWNAPLAWIAGYVDGLGGGESRG